MRGNHVFANGILFCRWALVAALAVLSLMTWPTAAVASGSEYAAFMDLATGAGKHTVSFGGGGTPMVTSGVPGPSAFGNMNSAAVGGGPGFTGTANLATPYAGKTVPVAVAQKVTRASAAAAIARFARVAGPIGQAVAIATLLDDLGVTCTWVPALSFNECKKTTSGSAGYWEYWPSGTSDGHQDAATFKARMLGGWDMTAGTYVSSVQGGGEPWASLNMSGTTSTGANKFQTIYMNYAFKQVTTQTETVVSEQELADAIAAESGWPQSATLAMAQAMNWPAQTVALVPDGPATVALPGPTTVQGPTEKVTTTDKEVVTTKTYDCLVIENGAAVSCAEHKTTTEQALDPTTKQPTGPKTTTSTTTTNPDTQSQEKPCDGTNTAIKCATLDAPPTLDVPTSSKTISYTPDSLGLGGGACPAPFTWQDHLGSHALSLTSYCSMLSAVVRPLILLAAALMAVFIVMPARE